MRRPLAEVSGAKIGWQPRPASYGLDRLREARTRLMAYRYGMTGRDAQLHIGLIGDSWMMIADNYPRYLARSIWGRLAGLPGYTSSVGMIGRGYTTFRNANDTNTSGTTTRFDVIGGSFDIGGAWTALTNSESSASINGQRSSEAGAFVGWTIDYGLSPQRSWTLHAGGGSGVLRYRWTDATAWTTVNLSAMATGIAIVPLTGAPTTGTGKLRIRSSRGP